MLTACSASISDGAKSFAVVKVSVLRNDTIKLRVGLLTGIWYRELQKPQGLFLEKIDDFMESFVFE